MKRTNSQSKRFYALINKLNINEDVRKELVFNATNSRTASSAEMFFAEMHALINLLQAELNKKERSEREIKQRKRRNIFKMAYDCGFFTGNEPNATKVSILDRWIANKMRLNKRLNDLTIPELDLMNKQFQAMRRVYAKNVKHN